MALQINAALAETVGLNEAIVLQQIHYWIHPKRNRNIFQGRHWVHNTYEQWQTQFPFWNLKKIQRVFLALEERGFLLSFSKCDHLQKTKYYTIAYDKIPQTLGFSASNNSVRSNVPNLSTQHPDLSSPSPQNETDQHPKNGRSYNLYTEITNKEEREEKKTEKRNKKEKSEKNFETKKEDLSDDLLRQMCDVWNRQIQQPLYGENSKILLTGERTQQLKTLHAEVLDSSSKAWENFCAQISQTAFLMGAYEGALRVTFDWAIEPQNARKILERKFYDKRSRAHTSFLTPSSGKYPTPSSDECIEILRAHCIKWQFPESWFKVCWHLTNELGYNRFRNWFQELVPIDLKSPTIRVRASGAFHRDWILEQYDRPFKQALKTVFPHMKNVTIEVSPFGEEVRPERFIGIRVNPPMKPREQAGACGSSRGDAHVPNSGLKGEALGPAFHETSLHATKGSTHAPQ